MKIISHTDIEKITVIGGGNIGTQFACACANKGYNVCLFTSNPLSYNKSLSVIGDTNELSYTGTIDLITDDIEKAIDNSNVIFITYPAILFDSLSKKIEPFIKKGMYLCFLPGTGGVEFYFQNCIKKGAILTGLQRVPGVARLIKKGESVRIKGLRDKLYLASIPSNNNKVVVDLIYSLFNIPCYVLPNYLAVTLTPSNPILHTTRLCSMFEDYKQGKYYDHNILFYEEWTDKASQLLFACDEELQKLCKLIQSKTGLDLRDVKSLKIHYESDTPSALTEKIRSIDGFKGLLSPMIETENGWIPDINNRYFSADFPYGLAIIKSLADVMDFPCKNITYVMNWYKSLDKNAKDFNLNNYGINNIDDIKNIYL